MPTIREKVAYERAALIVEREADRHMAHDSICGYCGEPWESEHGCMNRTLLMGLVEEIRAHKGLPVPEKA